MSLTRDGGRERATDTCPGRHQGTSGNRGARPVLRMIGPAAGRFSRESRIAPELAKMSGKPGLVQSEPITLEISASSTAKLHSLQAPFAVKLDSKYIQDQLLSPGTQRIVV